ncbi:peptidylprolyl isomerase [Spirillospora albida]|uniref:peptidylprolyl isomerase n=1 Tax=Spirillospora albida TaxID=58123 RepID=UPI0004C28756|nr:peptidylprolyl isomerase [Spirillospora albida]
MAAKDRKKQLARQRFERQQERRRAERARARRIKIIGAAGAVAVVAAGGGGVALYMNDSDADEGRCSYTAAPGESAGKAGRPPSDPAYGGMVQATVKTSQGDVVMQLDAGKAPCTVNSFAHLAKKNFFDGTPCHRMTSGGALNVLQCGDPQGTGMGGPGYQFPNENTTGATYRRGTLAMANSGADTNGSQFFMVYKDSELPPNYSVFGTITRGLDVLEKVAKGGTEPKGDGAPKKKVTIQDVTIAGK